MINIRNYGVIEIAGIEIWITETIVNTWIIMAILIAVAVLVRIKLRKFQTIPTGFQNVTEAAVEIFDNFVVSSIGKKHANYAPWFFMVFVLILSSSLFSIFGLRAPTADWATTFALALASFCIMIYAGVKNRKAAYMKSLFEPIFIFFPMNLIGELAKPVALSFRLFGNVLSGTIILTLYYALTPIFVQFGVPAVLHAFFDVIFGFIQTYIFVILSLMYVKMAADD